MVEPSSQAIADAIVRFYEEDWSDRLTQGVRDEKQRYLWPAFTAAIASITK